MKIQSLSIPSAAYTKNGNVKNDIKNISFSGKQEHSEQTNNDILIKKLNKAMKEIEIIE